VLEQSPLDLVCCDTWGLSHIILCGDMQVSPPPGK
jgi:hypothetical protein